MRHARHVHTDTTQPFHRCKEIVTLIPSSLPPETVGAVAKGNPRAKHVCVYRKKREGGGYTLNKPFQVPHFGHSGGESGSVSPSKLDLKVQLWY